MSYFSVRYRDYWKIFTSIFRTRKHIGNTKNYRLKIVLLGRNYQFRLIVFKFLIFFCYKSSTLYHHGKIGCCFSYFEYILIFLSAVDLMEIGKLNNKIKC